MNLVKLSNNVYFTSSTSYENYPNIGYIRGNKYSIMIDSCSSKEYLKDFENSLKNNNFRNPKLTIITNYYKDKFKKENYLKSKTISSININNKIKNAINCTKGSNLCFSGKTTFSLGNLTCEVLEIPSPYCNEAVSVFVKEDKILFLANALTSNNNPYNINNAKKLYKMLYALNFNKCLLSHLDKIFTKNEIMNILENQIDENKKRMA